MTNTTTSQLLEQAETLLTREVLRSQQIAALALERAATEGNIREVIQANLLLGMSKIHTGAVTEALQFLALAAQFLSQEYHPDLQARLLSSRGLALQQCGEFGQAIEAYLEALKLSEELGFSTQRPRVMSNIALLYIEIQEYERATEYLQQALKAIREMNNPGLELTFELNLLYCMLQMGQYNEVRQQSLPLLNRPDLQEFKRLLVLVQGNMAEALEKLGEYELGLSEARAAYVAALEQGLLRTQAELLQTIGQCEEALGHPEQAQLLFLQAIRLAQEIDDVHIEVSIHLKLQHLYKQQGRYKDSLFHAEESQRLVRQIHRELSQRRTQVAATEFELQRLRRLTEEHQERNAELLQLSQRDHLTGLLNRQGLIAYTAPFLKGPNQNHCALMVIDLNGFKQINDQWGHDTGDLLLVEVAHRIEQSLPGAIAARQGGDEFVCFIPELKSAEQAYALGKQLSDHLAQPVIMPESPEVSHQVTAAVGVALYPEHGQNLRTLQHAADLAMYQAKRQGLPVVLAS